MKSHRAGGIWITIVLFACYSGLANAEIRLSPNSTVRFASVQEGRALLGTADSFVNHMSALDRELRLKSEDRVTQQEYLNHTASQIVAWPENEEKKLTRVIEGVADRLSWLKCSLPREILLVQTTSRVEGGAPHTRGNAIVFPQGSLDGPAARAEHTFLHELFHVIVRENAQMRASLYRIVGFDTTTEMALPRSLRPRVLTNPDAPGHDVVIEVVYRGKTVTAAPVLLSNVDRYDKTNDRSFPVGYLDFKFMQVEKAEAGWGPKLAAGEAILMDPARVSRFFEQIGRNTQYIIHPEEILADNFAFVVTGREHLPSPEVPSALRALLSK